uniref:Uncharacterized protein n=1 Tax=virus sp. ctkyY8 TaxID=2827995 RepID=A0A8S5REQ6_9VIRU|nr:MAG TPA: hypothetical protein [virus sp. ctkyY8]
MHTSVLSRIVRVFQMILTELSTKRRILTLFLWVGVVI